MVHSHSVKSSISFFCLFYIFFERIFCLFYCADAFLLLFLFIDTSSFFLLLLLVLLLSSFFQFIYLYFLFFLCSYVCSVVRFTLLILVLDAALKHLFFLLLHLLLLIHASIELVGLPFLFHSKTYVFEDIFSQFGCPEIHGKF